MRPFSAIFPSTVNHVLEREPWARAKLKAHAGKVVQINLGMLVVRGKIARDGMLEAPADEEADAVVIRIQPTDLPLILQDRQRAVAHVKVEGDADFANTISQIAQTLQWEPEEDVSKWVGDIAANRLVAGARAAGATLKATHQALLENAAEYFTEENPMLMRAQLGADLAGDIVKLRDDVERLEKRIQKLAGQS